MEKVTGKLSFLNGLLKVNDIISAQGRNGLEEESRLIVYALCSIGYEIEIIKALAKGDSYIYE